MGWRDELRLSLPPRSQVGAANEGERARCQLVDPISKITGQGKLGVLGDFPVYLGERDARCLLHEDPGVRERGSITIQALGVATRRVSVLKVQDFWQWDRCVLLHPSHVGDLRCDLAAWTDGQADTQEVVREPLGAVVSIPPVAVPVSGLGAMTDNSISAVPAPLAQQGELEMGVPHAQGVGIWSVAVFCVWSPDPQHARDFGRKSIAHDARHFSVADGLACLWAVEGEAVPLHEARFSIIVSTLAVLEARPVWAGKEAGTAAIAVDPVTVLLVVWAGCRSSSGRIGTVDVVLVDLMGCVEDPKIRMPS